LQDCAFDYAKLIHDKPFEIPLYLKVKACVTAYHYMFFPQY